MAPHPPLCEKSTPASVHSIPRTRSGDFQENGWDSGLKKFLKKWLQRLEITPEVYYPGRNSFNFEIIAKQIAI